MPNISYRAENRGRKTKGLIRSLSRKSVRDTKSPQVERKTGQPHEPTVCARCGAVYLHKTWRHNHKLSDEMLENRQWGFCPACEQASRQEGQGKLIIRGSGLAGNLELVRRRIENVADRAMVTQPERRIVSVDTVDSRSGKTLEVLTTSQKLAHRIAHEVKKLFGGRTGYNWSDDGTLLATCDIEKRKRPSSEKKKARNR
jgi:NMD protein affecting ribosome stability and mRNA decay